MPLDVQTGKFEGRSSDREKEGRRPVALRDHLKKGQAPQTRLKDPRSKTRPTAETELCGGVKRKADD